jgi:hypothetical protein
MFCWTVPNFNIRHSHWATDILPGRESMTIWHSEWLFRKQENGAHKQLFLNSFNFQILTIVLNIVAPRIRSSPNECRSEVIRTLVPYLVICPVRFSVGRPTIGIYFLCLLSFTTSKVWVSSVNYIETTSFRIHSSSFMIFMSPFYGFMSKINVFMRLHPISVYFYCISQSSRIHITVTWYVWVTMDGVWIGEWISWSLTRLGTTNNYSAIADLQLYKSLQYTLSLHSLISLVFSWQLILTMEIPQLS